MRDEGSEESRAPCATRRRLLTYCAAGAAGLVAAPTLADARAAGERSLSFYNLHTGERARVVYWSGGQYLDTGLGEINRVLRDHRTGEVCAIDPELMDLLFALQRTLDSNRPYHVISGYRSPKTNTMLRARGSGVAKHSLHMDGRAIDVRLPGCALKDLRVAALSLKAGGVGYYPSSNFVHLDTGRVRFW
ncbi:MAG: DUF882 domain-containing protein [Gammaproteobacteria bacterium]|nr:DUF882 domain-containing protein [Gammaproteobacteria bacterium]